MPKNVVGSNAITTYNMIRLLLSFARTCGDDDTLYKSLTKIHLFLSYFFLFAANTCFFMVFTDCASGRLAGQT